MPKKTRNKKNNNRERGRKNNKNSRLRGTKDILFNEYKYWDIVLKKIQDLCDYYGFKRLDTPVLERFSLYEQAIGKETDILSKEIYSFMDKNGDKIALRPDATPGLVRSYIEHGMHNLPQPIKTYWLGPLFRFTKPQSGKLRQHTQFDLEIFGEPNPMADAQLILIAYNLFSELQIETQVQINSLGDIEDRKEYIAKLTDFYKERGKRSRLCNDCKKKFLKNPLRLLDCQEESCVQVREDAPQIVDFLGEESRDHFIKVLEYLDELGVPYNLNPFLVRGLDYYNRTVFEIMPVDNDGNDKKKNQRQLALAGGGRFDNLVEKMGGPHTPACGFGAGIERIILKIKEMNIPVTESAEDIFFLAQLGDQARRKMICLFEEMRRSGYNIRQSFTKDSLKAQLEEAGRIGARYSLILGQKELLDGTIIIRDMETGTQEVIDYKKLYNEIDKRLAEDKNEKLSVINEDNK